MLLAVGAAGCHDGTGAHHVPADGGAAASAGAQAQGNDAGGFGNAAGSAAMSPAFTLIDDGGIAVLPDGAVVYRMLWARPCPQDSTLDYASFGEAFFQSYCLRCHSAQRAGADRQSAPPTVNFDTLEEIRARADTIFEVAADGNTLMPASGTAPSHDERVLLGDWLACRAP
jgi:mono/diheme cytochrome c family protein